MSDFASMDSYVHIFVCYVPFQINILKKCRNNMDKMKWSVDTDIEA